MPEPSLKQAASVDKTAEQRFLFYFALSGALLTLPLAWLLVLFIPALSWSRALLILLLISLPLPALLVHLLHLMRWQSQLQNQLQSMHEQLAEEQRQHEKTRHELTNQRTRISQAIEASQLGLWEWDLETDTIYHSHFRDIFGYEDDEIPHFMGHLQPLVHPDDYPRLRQTLIEALKGHSAHFQCRFRIHHKSGDWRWLEDHGEVVERHETTGAARRMLGTRRDITAEQERDDHLQLAWRAFEASGEATYIVNANSQVIFINQAFVDITGYSRQDILNQSFWELPCFSEGIETYQAISRSLRHEGRWEGELVQKRRSGESYPQWLRVLRVSSGFRQDPYTIGIFSDMTQRRAVEARLNWLAQYDELTGLANRSQFYDRMHQSLSHAQVRSDHLALLIFDIDRFKAYNNSLGHQAGDRLLRLVAERILGSLQDASIIARTGSNEFAVLLEADEHQALLSAKLLQERMCRPFYLDHQELRLTLSIGISCYPKHTQELQVLVSQADQARLRCKAVGGNRMQLYNEEIRQSSLEQLRLEQDLRKALEQRDIRVYFQPKLELKTGSIHAAEVLARWHHPEQGDIPPSKFIPLAERTGLIEELGLLVLELACQQAAEWHRQGRSIQVAVNIAAQQLESGQLSQQVTQMLNRYELPARLLELELTESTLMEDAESAILEMQNLRNCGISLAIDDFGTGYSSLSYLQRFPLDVLKIDRSFLISNQGGKNQGTLTRAIIALGHGLGMRVVAEGVEEVKQLEALKRLGCDLVQGYVVSQPLPADDFSRLLQKTSH